MNAKRNLLLLIVTLLLTVSLAGVSTRNTIAQEAPQTACDIQSSEAVTPIELPPDANPDWWSAAQESIRISEYNITWQEQTYLSEFSAAYQAPNRAQNLRAYFTSNGLRIIPRLFEGQASAWIWGLTWQSYATSSNATPVIIGEPIQTVADGNRFEYRYGSSDPELGLQERFTNDRQGLAHRFILPALIGGDSNSAPDTITLSLTPHGDLVPALSVDRQAVDFNTANGARVLGYGQLAARDRLGRDLSAHFELAAELKLVVDAREAVFPITIDLLITAPSWAAEGTQVGEYFGGGAGTAGDVNGDGYADIVVGAPGYDNGQANEGRAFVYYGSATGLSLTPGWSAESNVAWAWFGFAARTAGDVNNDGYADVIVGAYGYSNGESYEGAAYVFHGSAGGLSPTPAWIGENNMDQSAFGISVSGAGDVNGDGYSDVIIGAPLYWGGGYIPYGAAYVYHGSTTGLVASPAWTVVGSVADGGLGSSVGTAGDVNSDGYADVVVGSEVAGSLVFYGSAVGLSATPNWTSTHGFSVGTAGDVNGDGYADVIVGNPSYSGGGAAFVYHGSASGLSPTANWIEQGGGVLFRLGSDVNTAGDVNGDGYADVIIGSGLSNPFEIGVVAVYEGSASGLSATPIAVVETSCPGDSYGMAVDTAGDVNGDGYSDVIVGAGFHGYYTGHQGNAYVYNGSPTGLSSAAGWAVDGEKFGAYLGSDVGSAGDVNGDGYADVIVGAQFYDNGQAAEGRAFAYYGSATGLSSTPDWTAESNAVNAYFGHSAGTAGDVNGDGYDDVIVGAYQYTDGQPGEGAIYAYLGSATGLSASPAWFLEGNQSDALLGWAVRSAGDVNADGYADVLVSALDYDNDQTNEGRIFLFLGSSAGLGTTPSWVVESNQSGSYFGHSLGTAGDVNGDGFSDVIYGAPNFANGQAGEGRAFVHLGSPSGLSATPSWTFESDIAYASLGYQVSTAGDVNGDGFADVVIGAPTYSNGAADEGAVFAFYGSSAGLGPTPDWVVEGGGVGQYLGRAVGTAGDINGDGYAEVLVSKLELFYHTQSAVYAYYGSPSGLGVTADWSVAEDQENSWFGWALGTAGDVNGDGYADIIIGAPQYHDTYSGEGRTLLYYGNGGKGLSVIPQQRRANNSAPIALLGKSNASNGFRIAALGRTPFGRGKVKLQWEVKPLGVAFDGTGLGQSAAWLDTTTAGVQLNELVSGLSAATTYHWRVRFLYHPVTTPFQQTSRWFTQPWNGWNETDLRTATPTPSCPILYLSFHKDGVIGDQLYADEDIVQYELCSGAWQMHFDGSANGLPAGTNIDAFVLLDNWILLSLKTAARLPGAGVVQPEDIVLFDTNTHTYRFLFDGSDVGLSGTNENVDAITISSKGQLLISTSGAFSIPATGGGVLTGEDEDLSVFSVTKWGKSTSGTFAMYFDGSDVELLNDSEDVWAAHVDQTTGNIYLSTLWTYSVPGSSGDGADVFLCVPGSLGVDTQCTYSSFWDGSKNGVVNLSIDGLWMEIENPGDGAVMLSNLDQIAPSGNGRYGR